MRGKNKEIKMLKLCNKDMEVTMMAKEMNENMDNFS